MTDMMRLVRQRAAHNDPMNSGLEIILGLVTPPLSLMQQPPVVVRERVRDLMMNSIVANLACGIGHPQRHAQNVLDEEHDERGPDDVPADDKERTYDLKPDLLSISVNSTAGVGETEGCAASGCCEKTRTDTADQGTNEMRMEDVEGVIDTLEEGNVALAEIESDLLYGLARVQDTMTG